MEERKKGFAGTYTPLKEPEHTITKPNGERYHVKGIYGGKGTVTVKPERKSGPWKIVSNALWWLLVASALGAAMYYMITG